MKDFKEVILLLLIMLLVGVAYIGAYVSNAELVKNIITIFLLIWCGSIAALVLRSRI